MNYSMTRGAGLIGLFALAGCVTQVGAADDMTAKSDPATVAAFMRDSFKEQGQAKLDRLEQSESQKICTAAAGKPVPADLKAKIEKEALAAVKYPEDGKYLGSWEKGMELAAGGRGFQFSDKAGSEVFGNCYACHQLDKAEVSYGNLGPSLYNYGKIRGNSEAMVKYTWARIWDSHAFNACNAMPRFGARNLLSNEQIKDAMAMLLDPESPVNK
ncbi:MAG: sulfur oxidation c-type cytochrome SoxX [Burkholderiaceae bacterium]